MPTEITLAGPPLMLLARLALSSRPLNPLATMSLLVRVRQTIALVACTGLVCGAVLLACRRLSGALSNPLPVATLAAAAVVLSLLIWLSRDAVLGRPQAALMSTKWRFGTWAGGPLIAAAICAAAISVPGSAILGIGTLWCVLGLVGAAALRSPARTARPTIGFPGRASAARRRSVRQTEAAFPTATPGESQCLVRGTWLGQDVVQGRVVLSIPAGRRAAAAHLAFCPPFVTEPRVEITSRSQAIGVEISVGQILPHGVRFDAKVTNAASEPLTVPFEFRAVGVALDKASMLSAPRAQPENATDRASGLEGTE